jgi:uncharacterized membrane protein YgdD (TMEM256/DUF423 family)
MMNKNYSLIAILGASAVALGALGAHALKNKLSGGLITEEQLNGFDTGVKYQMYHTLAMMMLLLLNKNDDNKWLKYSFRFFKAGILLFSGSLYFLTTRNLWGAEWLKVLGPVTPIGGLLFMAGWLMLMGAVLKSKK